VANHREKWPFKDRGQVKVTSTLALPAASTAPLLLRTPPGRAHAWDFLFTFSAANQHEFANQNFKMLFQSSELLMQI
jgi:hypothetical protein